MTNPLGEVFGFPTTNLGDKAQRYRSQKLCPYNNTSPNCTKDKVNNPLGVCSIIHNEKAVITCPVRFRQDWIIIEEAAKFAFGKDSNWTSLVEVKLKDANGKSAGNIDYVLVSYDADGAILDFASLEVQGVYISGNLRDPFEAFLSNPSQNFSWDKKYKYPKPDYLSSSRKRLIPQMLYKGGIFNAWGKKQAVALQKSFFETLPGLSVVKKSKADIAWFLYDLVYNNQAASYDLELQDVVYTDFQSTLLKVTIPQPGDVERFKRTLKGKLNKKLHVHKPTTSSVSKFINKKK